MDTIALRDLYGHYSSNCENNMDTVAVSARPVWTL